MKNTGLMSIVVGCAGVGVLGFALAANGRSSKPTASPGTVKPQSKLPPEEAARALFLYLTQAPNINWGSKAAPNKIIRDGQTYMGGGLVADGIYGPKTQARGATLTGKAWPVRPGVKPAAVKPAAKPPSAAAATIPSYTPALESDGTAHTAKPEPAPSTSAAPRPNAPPGASAVSLPAQVVAPAQRTTKEAARALLNYVTPIIRSGRGAAELGSKETPNHFVAAAQRDMRGGIASDGIYGPKTQARGKELLGETFPSRYGTSTKIAASNSTNNVLQQPPPTPAITAAEALLAYVSKPGADFGSRGKPSAFVKASQGAMGGITADGIYGPATRARGALLTGKTFPQRK